jgi:hypothetical protein
MEPKDLVKASVSTFNQADVEALTAFYSENAVNHQVTDSPRAGPEDGPRDVYSRNGLYRGKHLPRQGPSGSGVA